MLQQAVSEMSWLHSHGYADKSTLKLVGDRYALTQRQRTAVMRTRCSDCQLENRTRKQIQPEQSAGLSLAIDGYNLLITIEAALARRETRPAMADAEIPIVPASRPKPRAAS